MRACCFQTPGEKPNMEYIYFSVHLFPDFFFLNADQAGLLTIMIRNLHYSLHLDFVFLRLGFLVLRTLSAPFKIMLSRLAITAYSLKNESECCKPFIECFKDEKRKIICIRGTHVHKILTHLFSQKGFIHLGGLKITLFLSITTLSVNISL